MSKKYNINVIIITQLFVKINVIVGFRLVLYFRCFVMVLVVQRVSTKRSFNNNGLLEAGLRTCFNRSTVAAIVSSATSEKSRAWFIFGLGFTRDKKIQTALTESAARSRWARRSFQFSSRCPSRFIFTSNLPCL